MADSLDPDFNALGPIMGSMLDAVIAIDTQGNVVDWNDVATRTFGWEKHEAIGRPLGDLVVPTHLRESHDRGIRHYQATGSARVLNRRLEIIAKDKTGREFPIELSIIETRAGRAAFIGFLRDISDQRAAQKRLMVSEESLRLTMQAAEIGIWDVDIINGTLIWSDRTKAMFGISPDVPVSLEDFYGGLHPEDREAATQAFQLALNPAVRASYDVQYRTIGKEDDIIRWVAAKGKALFDENDCCVRAVGTAIDITARKLAEARHAFMLELSDLLRDTDTDAALNEVCALMGRFFAVSRVGYGQLDPQESIFNYTICWTDGIAVPLLGRFPAEAFGKKIVAKLSAGETVVVDDLLVDSISDEAQTRETAKTVDTRAILVVPFVRDGQLRSIVYLNDRPARRWTTDEINFMEDVAERVRQVIGRAEAERALRSLNATLESRVAERTQALKSTEEALRQAQKMEAIGQLTGGIAHDFNNLLQGISGSLELLRRRLAQKRTDDLDRFINAAATSAERAAALTHRLLAFARRQPLKPRPLHANPLVLSMGDLLRHTLGEKIELKLELADDLWQTCCDPNQLENTLLNLAINARDAMPDGGILTIKTSNEHLTGHNAAMLDVRPDRYIFISVSDTGMGMDTHTLAKAFDPFFTTKPTGKGTGLGLSMVYGFARQSNGMAQIESTLGQGTTFKLYLPYYDGPEEVEAPTARTAAPISDGEVVLVVEDEPIVRALIVELLQELGYIALEASNGPAGLAILQSDQRIDLLITDVGLPGLNGRQIVDAAREQRPDLKVIFMTGYAESVGVKFHELGTNTAVVTKPFSMDALAKRIREVIDGTHP